MTRFASTLIRVNDDRRVQKIREDEAQQVARDFAPIKAKIARNMAAARAPRALPLY